MVIKSTLSPTTKVGLRFLGMWPSDSYSIIRWLSVMLITLIIQYFQYLYVFDHLKMSELSNLVDSLIMTLDYSLTLFKLTSLWIHRRIFHEILADMDNDWRECINIAQHLHTMTIKANISRFVSNIMLSFTASVALLYLLDTLMSSAFLTADYNDTLRELPIHLQIPFEVQRSPIFEFLIGTVILYGMVHDCTIAILNGLILTLVLHVSGQIEIMCHEFKNVSKITLHEPFAPLFGILIERHNRIISFSKNIESFYSFIALMQVVWNTLVICCLGFVTVISIHDESGAFIVMKNIGGYFAVLTEIFVICFAGEYLSLKGKLITNAIYETMWYDMPSRQSKIIIFIIMRSQKRLMITAGKMVDISFETFTSIMKASASYVSLLYAMY